jgi:hypothetical protein
MGAGMVDGGVDVDVTWIRAATVARIIPSGPHLRGLPTILISIKLYFDLSDLQKANAKGFGGILSYSFSRGSRSRNQRHLISVEKLADAGVEVLNQPDPVMTIRHGARKDLGSFIPRLESLHWLRLEILGWHMVADAAKRKE